MHSIGDELNAKFSIVRSSEFSVNSILVKFGHNEKQSSSICSTKSGIEIVEIDEQEKASLPIICTFESSEKVIDLILSLFLNDDS